MFREMRRKDRQMDDVEAVALLKKCTYGVLSVIGEHGYAYGVPLSYVYLNGAIYFHSANEGAKLDCIRANEQVSFCVVGDTNTLPDKFSTEYESVIVFGRAEETDEGEKNEALLGLLEKYSNYFFDKGIKYIQSAGDITTVIKITVDHMTGKARR